MTLVNWFLEYKYVFVIILLAIKGLTLLLHDASKKDVVIQTKDTEVFNKTTAHMHYKEVTK